MIVAIIPGFTRNASAYVDWDRRLQGHEVRSYDLPGHAREPALSSPSFAALIDHFLARVPPEALVVGESLGGLIALGMAAAGRAAVAIDPPLSMSKQWVLQKTLPDVISSNPRAPWLAEFIAQIFGVPADPAALPPDYWTFVESLKAPVDVIAASEPLWPVREIELTAANCPSSLDEADLERLERAAMVRLHRVEGPHGLMLERPDSVHTVLQTILYETKTAV